MLEGERPGVLAGESREVGFMHQLSETLRQPDTSVESPPASGGTAAITSVEAKATTVMARCIASSRESPSDVQRAVCRNMRRRGSAANLAGAPPPCGPIPGRAFPGLARA